ncbi:MAG: hypothetical protein AB8G86_06980 [Saprospiraceae bacterium]
MNQDDFIKLHVLLAKLDVAAHKAATIDGTFKKYHTGSIEKLRDLPVHLRQLEQGLKTANVVPSTY